MSACMVWYLELYYALYFAIFQAVFVNCDASNEVFVQFTTPQAAYSRVSSGER